MLVEEVALLGGFGKHAQELNPTSSEILWHLRPCFGGDNDEEADGRLMGHRPAYQPQERTGPSYQSIYTSLRPPAGVTLGFRPGLSISLFHFCRVSKLEYQT